MPCYAIDKVCPVVDPSSFIHPMATIIGDVIIGSDCYIGPGAVLRGDFGSLLLKQGVNVQDTCVLHSFPGGETIIEKNGHIGHGAVLHGCHIGENALVGMNAVIMDEVSIGRSSIVAAMSFVRAKTKIPDRHLAMGTPAKVIRELTDEEISWKESGTDVYHALSRRCFDSLIETDPLTEIDKDRPQLKITDYIPKHRLGRSSK